MPTQRSQNRTASINTRLEALPILNLESKSCYVCVFFGAITYNIRSKRTYTKTTFCCSANERELLLVRPGFRK